MMRWIKLDWSYLKFSGFLLKLPLLLLIIFIGNVGYHHFSVSSSTKEMVNSQLEAIDQLKVSVEEHTRLDESERSHLLDVVKDFYQTFAQENSALITKASTQEFITIYEKRLVSVQAFEEIGEESWSEWIPNRAEIEETLQLLNYLSTKQLDFVTYKQYGKEIQTIYQFIGYGGLLFIYIGLVGAFYERKNQHKTLLEIVPISFKVEIAVELLYTFGWFYVFPAIVLLFYMFTYGIVVKECLFIYPIFTQFVEINVVYPAYQGILLGLSYPILSLVGILIFQSYLMKWTKDYVVSTILFYCISYLSIWTGFGWLFFPMHFIPSFQKGYSVGLVLITGIGYSIIVFLFKMVERWKKRKTGQ